MKDLIQQMSTENNQPKVSSRVVAEKFKKEHRSVLRAIRNVEVSEEFRVRNFVQSNHVNKQGKSHEEFLLTRDGFSLLIMGFTGEDATKWKEQFLNAFNEMERLLLKGMKGEGWNAARLQSKEYRLELTDVIQMLVEYAKNQGSKNADRYYASITTMEYKALQFLEKGSKIGKNFRDTLDKMQINVLCMAEQVAKHWILEGMNQGLHYKEIYQLAKQKVEEYSDIACITCVPNKPKL